MAFRAKLKICFGDIDHAGIIYYPRFVHYFHVALEEFFTCELGVDYPTVMHKYNFAFPTVHLSADFHKKLRFGDHIEVEVMVLKLGRTSITWGYKAFKTGDPKTVVVEGHNVTVCVKTDRFEKMEIPDWFRRELEAYQGRCA